MDARRPGHVKRSSPIYCRGCSVFSSWSSSQLSGPAIFTNAASGPAPGMPMNARTVSTPITAFGLFLRNSPVGLLKNSCTAGSAFASAALSFGLSSTAFFFVYSFASACARGEDEVLARRSGGGGGDEGRASRDGKRATWTSISRRGCARSHRFFLRLLQQRLGAGRDLRFYGFDLLHRDAVVARAALRAVPARRRVRSRWHLFHVRPSSPRSVSKALERVEGSVRRLKVPLNEGS